MKSKEFYEMRTKLIEVYPSGYIRGQRILDMSEAQIYAIYRSHNNRRIPMDRPRMKRNKQIQGQMKMKEYFYGCQREAGQQSTDQ